MLAWGSFLNVIGYRIIHKKIPFWAKRSQCPRCLVVIKWYDNIPLISWVLLSGNCRSCGKPISFLYPFIEFITAISMLSLLYSVPHQYLLAYFIFFSALIVSIRTDLETYLLSSWVTRGLIPFGLLFSATHLLPITIFQSLSGAIFAYLFLFAISKTYSYFTDKIGIGTGDLELLAGIGAFIGFGWWFTLIIASFLGSLVGLALMIYQKKILLQTKIPFGPFLAFGAMTYVLFYPVIKIYYPFL